MGYFRVLDSVTICRNTYWEIYWLLAPWEDLAGLKTIKLYLHYNVFLTPWVQASRCVVYRSDNRYLCVLYLLTGHAHEAAQKCNASRDVGFQSHRAASHLQKDLSQNCSAVWLTLSGLMHLSRSLTWYRIFSKVYYCRHWFGIQGFCGGAKLFHSPWSIHKSVLRLLKGLREKRMPLCSTVLSRMNYGLDSVPWYPY